MEAFREFVKRHESQVASTVVGMLGSCPEAEDIGQETFIRFYKALPNFRGDSEPATYLIRIAINLSLNEIKRRKRRHLFFPRSTEEVKQTAADSFTFEDREASEWVHKALDQLDPKFRSVIVLRLLDGYSTRETAEILNIPEGTVLSRLSRAQTKLKEILQPILGEAYE